MTTNFWSRRSTPEAGPTRRWVLLAVVATVAAGCGADGMTPNCPELPIYSLRSAAGQASAGHLTPAQSAMIQAAIDEGCVSPTGTAVSAEGGAP